MVVVHPRRLTEGGQERRHRLRDDLSEGESAVSGVGADCAYGADRQLEGDRDGRFDRRQRRAQPGRFLEIAIGLPSGQRELAPEVPGCLGAFHLLSEQAVRGVEQARLVGLGGPRHEV